jgi:hypothetical protein
MRDTLIDGPTAITPYGGHLGQSLADTGRSLPATANHASGMVEAALHHHQAEGDRL